MMSVTLLPGPLSGTVTAPPSKSMTQRLLILAALGRGPVTLRAGALSEDAQAVIACLRALDAEIRREDGRLHIRPISATPHRPCVLDCGESGAALRFLLPAAGSLGASCSFLLRGRLPERPMAPLEAELRRHGMSIEREGSALLCSGRLLPGEYSLPGDISSQFISGLLMALPRLPGESRLRVTGGLQSAAYVDMTLAALSAAGCALSTDGNAFLIPGSAEYRLPESCAAEGDWSGAAFWLCAGALGGPGVAVRGLSADSAQGDRAILRLLSDFGARAEQEGEFARTGGGSLRGIELDAEQIPDLVPALCIVAAAAEGETRIYGASRLRYKESDRLRACAELLRTLGGKARELPDGLVIEGGGLRGGSVRCGGDHRIAMAAALAACICRERVSIDDAACVSKSYPEFWTDRIKLGGKTI